METINFKSDLHKQICSKQDMHLTCVYFNNIKDQLLKDNRLMLKYLSAFKTDLYQLVDDELKYFDFDIPTDYNMKILRSMLEEIRQIIFKALSKSFSKTFRFSKGNDKITEIIVGMLLTRNILDQQAYNDVIETILNISKCLLTDLTLQTEYRDSLPTLALGLTPSYQEGVISYYVHTMLPVMETMENANGDKRDYESKILEYIYYLEVQFKRRDYELFKTLCKIDSRFHLYKVIILQMYQELVADALINNYDYEDEPTQKLIDSFRKLEYGEQIGVNGVVLDKLEFFKYLLTVYKHSDITLEATMNFNKIGNGVFDILNNVKRTVKIIDGDLVEIQLSYKEKKYTKYIHLRRGKVVNRK